MLDDADGRILYLDEEFVADFNRRFTVEPAQPGSASTRVAGLDLALRVSVQHERIVSNLVHELLDDTLGVSFSGKLIARFDRQGTGLPALPRAA
jgi:hypothetical protein